MRAEEKPKRKKLNAVERRERKAAEIQIFIKEYARKAQAGADPNDRSYSSETEKMIRRMSPEQLDELLRHGEE